MSFMTESKPKILSDAVTHSQRYLMFHVFYGCPDNTIRHGVAPDPRHQTFASFEDAKAHAVKDLEQWIDKIDAGIARLKAATKPEDFTDAEWLNEH
jgi:hypothetical protein